MEQLIDLKTPLDYNNGETNGIPEDAVRINASGIAGFFTNTRQWFGEKMLKEEGFTGNTATVNGTLVHYILERFARTQTISGEDKVDIANYLKKHTTRGYKDFNPEIDINYIEDNYKHMGETAVNDYLADNMPSRTEDFVAEEILPASYVCSGKAFEKLKELKVE